MKDAVLTCSLCAEKRPVATRLFAFCPECGKEIRRSVPAPRVDAPAPAFVAAAALPEPVIDHAMVVPTATVPTVKTADRRATGIRRTWMAATVAAVVAAAAAYGAAVWKMGTPDTPRVAGTADTPDDPGVVETTDKQGASSAIENSGEFVELRTIRQDDKKCAVFKESYFKRENDQTIREERVNCDGVESLY